MAAPMEVKDLLANTLGTIKFLRDQTKTNNYFEEVEEIDYTSFFINSLLPNEPCILTPDVTKYWKSRRKWVLENNTPNFAYLRRKFGEAHVPVANCKQEQYSSHPKQDMLFSQYLDYWEKYRTDGYPADEPCLYLKDWHFTKTFPEYQAYLTPVYFQSDWLNEFWDTLPQDDYRFVYMGPKGTWTPFHADVYRSYSWSANICGKKKWIFYPPGCEENLKDCFGNLVYDITSPELDNQKKFPNAHKVKGQMIEVIQGEGQIIFVPSGWHHEVFNLEDTISINHNWLNGCNIDICWKHLQDSLQDVKKEIENCRDMDGWNMQCQLILKACAGIDYMEFIQMLRVIAENRIEQYRRIQKKCSGCTQFMTEKSENSSRDARLELNNTGPELESWLSCRNSASENWLSCRNLASELETDSNAVLTDQGENNKGDVKCVSCRKGEETEQETCKCRRTVFGCEEKEICDKFSCSSELLSIFKWREVDYIIFDMNCIKEILQCVISDEDYRCIEKERDDSAESIIEMLEKVEIW